MSCGVGRRCSSDPASLWLCGRLAAVAPIRPLALEFPYAVGVALKKKHTHERKKKRKKEKKKERKKEKERKRKKSQSQRLEWGRLRGLATAVPPPSLSRKIC